MSNDPRTPPPIRPLLDPVLTWLVPGAGYLRAGLRREGLILLIVIGGLFIGGLVLSDMEAVSRTLHPYAFWAQVGVGGFTLPLAKIDFASEQILPGSVSIKKYQSVPPLNDTGVVFCCIAGLLNLLTILDLTDRRLNRQRWGSADSAGEGSS
ncbi:MAG TPA: hypothetical protein EYN79_10785 [Planctomycetes bacterium]|nr:hypothetical protein [Planctomycetota bacterium]HIN80358.1 hypothetical protein [Planctomycetota bacterium]